MFLLVVSVLVILLMIDKITQQNHYRQILPNILSVQIVKGQK